jgi:acyl-CoA synthetase (AMP-forming)/AMP-acid ligase II
LITFTTGSTGAPKAANRTHGFLKAQFDALLPLLKGRDENPDMPLLPIVLLLNLGLGETSIIADTNFSKPLKFEPEKLALQLRETECSSLSGSPWFILKLAEYCFHNRFEIKLKHIYTGGGPVSPEDARFLNAVFPKAKITILYGSTEAEPISHLSAADLSKQSPEELISKGLWVGKVDSNARVKLVRLHESINEETISRSEVKTGEVGEILVSGAHVLKEYWNNPEATKETKIQEADVLWHRTGDCGRMDADGNLYLLGRCKWVFNYHGIDYYPFAIEYFLRTIPGIKAGCLIKKNYQPELFLETNADYKEKTVSEILIEKKLNFPITILKNIPRDPRHLSKVDYEKLHTL